MCRPPNRKLHPCLAKSWKSEIQQMRSAIPAQKRSERNAPTAGFNCAKIMWKPVADVMRSSVRGEGRASVHDTTYDPLVEQNRCQVGPTILFECPAQIPRSSLRSFSRLSSEHRKESPLSVSISPGSFSSTNKNSV